MIPLSNIHTHTTFSDGRDTAAEMVHRALELGFHTLGFSDHGYCVHDDGCMSLEVEKAYRSEVLRLRAQGTLSILLGYEHDAAADCADFSPYDYLIESVHYLHRDGVYMPIDSSAAKLQQAIDQMYSGDPFAMCRDYFDSVCRSVSEFSCDVVGHIGLVTKFNEHNEMFDSSDPRYTGPARETIALAAEKDVLVEINTGAMSRGYRTTPYPSPDLLKLLHSLGGRITITSDCHRAEWIDFAFDSAIDLAKSAGFREAWIWKNGKFTAEGL